MKHEVKDNDIVFTVDIDHLGKFGFLQAINKVKVFWEDVRFYRQLDRQQFDSIIIKLNRTGVFNHTDSIYSDTKRTVE